MDQPAEEGKPQVAGPAFVVAAPSGSLIGALLRGLVEQRFPEAECGLESIAVMPRAAASVTNVSNGHSLLVFVNPPGPEDFEALRSQTRTSAVELSAQRAEIELALKSLEEGFCYRSRSMLASMNREPEVSLTRRERQVAHLVAQGMSNSEIAAVLGISPHTVRTHVAAASSRLGVTSRAKLASRVRELQL